MTILKTLLIAMVCWSCTGSLSARAQENTLLFENYTSEKGLSQNSGYAITQDRQGFLWVGTQDGLNRFDGIGFRVFRNEVNRNTSLPFNEISTLLTDADGNVWIGGPMGIAIYHSSSNNFYSISDFFKTGSGINQVAVNKIFEDHDKNIWVVSRYNGLFCFNKKTRKIAHFLNDKTVRDKLNGITEDQRQKIWVGAGEELYSFDGTSFIPYGLNQKLRLREEHVTITDLAMLNGQLWAGSLHQGIFIIDPISGRSPKRLQAGNTNRLLSSNDIKCLLRDRHDNMWIGTRNAGICQYISKTGEIIKGSYSYFVEHSIRKNFVLSLFEDNQGIIWAGLSGGGLAKYDPEKYQFQTYRQLPGTANSLPDNMIFCLYGKSDNELLIGTQNGGMVKFDTKDKQFTSFQNIPGNPRSLLNNTVYGIARDDDHNFWAATWGGLCKYDPSKPPDKAFTQYPHQLATNLYAITKLKNENCLLVGSFNGLFMFDLSSKSWRPNKDINSYMATHGIVARNFSEQDDSSKVWIATEGLGLLLYNYATGTIEEAAEVNAVTRNIRYIFQDEERLWLASDNGLIRYNPNTRRVTGVWNAINGLPNDVVYGILKDNAGKLWLSTNNGLSCFNTVENSFKNYDVSYGLQAMEFNTAACYNDKQGNLYFGGINGFNVFDPSNLSPNKYAPVAYITSIKIFDRELETESNLNFTRTIDLDYQQNFINIEFTALNYSHTEKNSYAYMLEGVDQDWTDAGKRNFASYTQLLPGKYVFNVKAANSDGKWSDEVKQLEIIIHPPFWSAWWFRILLLALLVGLVFWLYKTKTDQIRKQERLKADFNKKIANAETAALRAQMNPHFIFNTLNSINSYIIDNNPRIASDYLTKFARLIRIILDNSKHETIPLSKEIETLKLYLLMESVRFGNKFDYEIRIDEMADYQSVRVPPMIIQPYVENAIWHGLLHKEEKGTAIISIIRKQPGLLEVRITDNGIGRQKAMEMKSKDSNSNKSYGMKITSDRLMMSHEKNTVEMIDLTDELGNAAGTTVVLSLTI